MIIKFHVTNFYFFILNVFVLYINSNAYLRGKNPFHDTYTLVIDLISIIMQQFSMKFMKLMALLALTLISTVTNVDFNIENNNCVNLTV